MRHPSDTGGIGDDRYLLCALCEIETADGFSLDDLMQELDRHELQAGDARGCPGGSRRCLHSHCFCNVTDGS
jgi:hypothetical protein